MYIRSQELKSGIREYRLRYRRSQEFSNIKEMQAKVKKESGA